MSKIQVCVAACISLLAFGLMAVRFFYPAFPVDATTLGLLGLAVLPWLTLFFKKFKVPGILEGESQDRVQSSTTSPTPPPMESLANEGISQESPERIFHELPDESQKILRTLWRYQKDHFKSDYSKRWTFTVLPNAPHYMKYLIGIAALLEKRYVSVTAENGQCMLTNEGIIFMESLGDGAVRGDFYVF